MVGRLPEGSQSRKGTSENTGWAEETGFRNKASGAEQEGGGRVGLSLAADSISCAWTGAGIRNAGAARLPGALRSLALSRAVSFVREVAQLNHQSSAETGLRFMGLFFFAGIVAMLCY